MEKIEDSEEEAVMIIGGKKKYLNIFLKNNISLLPISGFVLEEKFQRNASKFGIFYIYENPKLLFPFFISS